MPYVCERISHKQTIKIMKITVELLTQWHDNDILFFASEATINDSIINKVLARIEGENFVKNFEKEVANA